VAWDVIFTPIFWGDTTIPSWAYRGKMIIKVVAAVQIREIIVNMLSKVYNDKLPYFMELLKTYPFVIILK
jgi:hypothetical protein